MGNSPSSSDSDDDLNVDYKVSSIFVIIAHIIRMTSLTWVMFSDSVEWFQFDTYLKDH